MTSSATAVVPVLRDVPLSLGTAVLAWRSTQEELVRLAVVLDPCAQPSSEPWPEIVPGPEGRVRLRDVVTQFQEREEVLVAHVRTAASVAQRLVQRAAGLLEVHVDRVSRLEAQVGAMAHAAAEEGMRQWRQAVEHLRSEASDLQSGIAALAREREQTRRDVEIAKKEAAEQLDAVRLDCARRLEQARREADERVEDIRREAEERESVARSEAAAASVRRRAEAVEAREREEREIEDERRSALARLREESEVELARERAANRERITKERDEAARELAALAASAVEARREAEAAAAAAWKVDASAARATLDQELEERRQADARERAALQLATEAECDELRRRSQRQLAAERAQFDELLAVRESTLAERERAQALAWADREGALSAREAALEARERESAARWDARGRQVEEDLGRERAQAEKRIEERRAAVEVELAEHRRAQVELLSRSSGALQDEARQRIQAVATRASAVLAEAQAMKDAIAREWSHWCTWKDAQTTALHAAAEAVRVRVARADQEGEARRIRADAEHAAALEAREAAMRSRETEFDARLHAREVAAETQWARTSAEQRLRISAAREELRAVEKEAEAQRHTLESAHRARLAALADELRAKEREVEEQREQLAAETRALMTQRAEALRAQEEQLASERLKLEASHRARTEALEDALRSRVAQLDAERTAAEGSHRARLAAFEEERRTAEESARARFARIEEEHQSVLSALEARMAAREADADARLEATERQIAAAQAAWAEESAAARAAWETERLQTKQAEDELYERRRAAADAAIADRLREVNLTVEVLQGLAQRSRKNSDHSSITSAGEDGPVIPKRPALANAATKVLASNRFARALRGARKPDEPATSAAKEEPAQRASTSVEPSPLPNGDAASSSATSGATAAKDPVPVTAASAGQSFLVPKESSVEAQAPGLDVPDESTSARAATVTAGDPRGEPADVLLELARVRELAAYLAAELSRLRQQLVESEHAQREAEDAVARLARQLRTAQSSADRLRSRGTSPPLLQDSNRSRSFSAPRQRHCSHRTHSREGEGEDEERRQEPEPKPEKAEGESSVAVLGPGNPTFFPPPSARGRLSASFTMPAHVVPTRSILAGRASRGLVAATPAFSTPASTSAPATPTPPFMAATSSSIARTAATAVDPASQELASPSRLQSPHSTARWVGCGVTARSHHASAQARSSSLPRTSARTVGATSVSSSPAPVPHAGRSSSAGRGGSNRASRARVPSSPLVPSSTPKEAPKAIDSASAATVHPRAASNALGPLLRPRRISLSGLVSRPDVGAIASSLALTPSPEDLPALDQPIGRFLATSAHHADLNRFLIPPKVREARRNSQGDGTRGGLGEQGDALDPGATAANSSEDPDVAGVGRAELLTALSEAVATTDATAGQRNEALLPVARERRTPSPPRPRSLLSTTGSRALMAPEEPIGCGAMGGIHATLSLDPARQGLNHAALGVVPRRVPPTPPVSE